MLVLRSGKTIRKNLTIQTIESFGFALSEGDSENLSLMVEYKYGDCILAVKLSLSNSPFVVVVKQMR